VRNRKPAPRDPLNRVSMSLIRIPSSYRRIR
jgi:hypothetical protein